VNGPGDTFHARYEELRYLAPLLKNIPSEEIEWQCYFSKIPEGTRVIGVNRAGYPVFVEVPLGTGKLIMLPRFKDRRKAVTTIINEIIPQVVHEEFVFTPKWLPDFSSPYETQLRSVLKELENARKLLYTKDKFLKKAVAWAFQKLGFQVTVLPDGTMPDLKISNGVQTAVVEVKGHENKQADRKDVLQLLGYLSEEDTKEKGIFVSNHEFSCSPDKRSEKAFIEGAVKLGGANTMSLISSADLYQVIMKEIESKLDETTLQRIRNKIMNGNTIVSLSV
jgi:hypothetical protein